jgi:hypothetical protein
VDYASMYVDTAALVEEAKQGPAAAQRLGWRLYSELATAVGDRRTIIVLDGAKELSDPLKVKLSPQVALLVMPNGGGGGSAAATAAEVVGWLADGVPQQGADKAAAARSLREACLQKAAAAAAATTAEFALGGQTGVVVTPGLALAAETAVEAYEAATGSSGSWQDGLAKARTAAAAAAALGAHPDLATPPQLPPEHALTMLLPIALPVCLAVVQALGREAKAARQRRRRRRNSDGDAKAD